MYPPYFSDVQTRSGDAFLGEGSLQTLSLLKLHGSINWYYSGRLDFFGETILFSEDLPLCHEVWRTERFRRPQSRDKEPLIIPPVLEKTTYFNNETVRRLWREAGEALSHARRVFIIGYSLPSSDIGMKFFLKSHLDRNTTTVHVIDIDSTKSEHYREQLRLDVSAEFSHVGNPVKDFVQSYSSDN